MRLFIPIIFIAFIILWFSYRFFIKKDLKKHKNEAYLGGFFILIWVIIYYFLIK